jgi:hypothetical protein
VREGALFALYLIYPFLLFGERFSLAWLSDWQYISVFLSTLILGMGGEFGDVLICCRLIVMGWTSLTSGPAASLCFQLITSSSLTLDLATSTYCLYVWSSLGF